MSNLHRLAALGVVLVALSSCTSGDQASGQKSDAGDAASPVAWRQVFTALPGALISVAGSSDTDVWAVGSDTHDGNGPLVLHFDGTRWTRKIAGAKGDLWWVHELPDGSVLAGGSSGVIVRYDAATRRFAPVSTPKTKGTVYGIWGTSPTDVWAVGGDTTFGTGAFVWHSDGTGFVARTDLPVDLTKLSALFKVWGASAFDIWIVGSDGVSLHFDGQGFTSAPTSVPDPLFTVHVAAGSGRSAIVGGADLGVLLERDTTGAWKSAPLPDGTRQLFGVWLTGSRGWAVGADETVLSQSAGLWTRAVTGLPTEKALHAVWEDPAGGIWAVGGDVLTPPLGAGVMVHRGSAVPTTVALDDGVPTDAALDAPMASGGGGVSGAGGASGKGSGGEGGRFGAGGGGGVSPRGDGGPRDASVDGAASDAAVGGAGGAGGVQGAGGAPGFDAGTLPGQIRCGASTCTLPAQQCCADATTGAPSGCIDAAVSCNGSEAPVTCDESSDCSSGSQCCVTRFTQSGLLFHVACAPTCDPDPVACRSDGGCAQGTCSPFLPMPSFLVCQ